MYKSLTYKLLDRAITRGINLKLHLKFGISINSEDINM